MLRWFQRPQDAYALIARKNYPKAAKVLRQQLKREPHSIHLRKLLADVHERSGDTAQAVAILDSLVEEFTEKGFAAKAIAVHKKIQRLDPERSDLDFELATLIEEKRDETSEAEAPEFPEYEAPGSDFVKVEDGFSRQPLPTSVIVSDWFEQADLRQDFHWSPLLAGFAKEELAALIGGLRLLVKKPGAIVYGQGEPGQSMFILANGKARIYRRNKARHYEQVGVLHEGQFFGEASILTDGDRLSTITAASECELLELDGRPFNASPRSTPSSARRSSGSTRTAARSRPRVGVESQGGRMMPNRPPTVATSLALVIATLCPAPPAAAQRTVKPVLHGKHWVAITGKPLAATAGAVTFARGGNAVDATCAMLAATCTMWDTLGWGGETQALVYNPHRREVKGINALGVAPTGATVEYFKEKGHRYPPEHGPLAAVTPGTPGGLMVMLAEYGKLSLAEVLEPAMQMAEGYPIEASQADNMERRKELLAEWPYSKKVFLPHFDDKDSERAAPYPGEVFRQLDLLETLRKLVAAEKRALAAGKSRKQAIYAAYDRFYRGDIAEELVRSTREMGGLITMQDLDSWQVHIEEPVTTDYRGIQVYKLTHWVQGPVMLQALNILENADVEAMGYNSAAYVHALYQAMNLAFADRDFYYGDPYTPPEEPIAGLLSKEYARHRYQQIDWKKNDADAKPGDPYPFQGGENPFLDLLEKWTPIPPEADAEGEEGFQQAFRRHAMSHEEAFRAGTTSIQAADAEGWVVSVTPSGAWIPAVIAGETGVGLSQRMQSFVLDEGLNPYNLVAPGKRPRATLTPGMALKDGEPYLSFAVQGGDTQDQNLLQFFLNVVEFGMNVQQAVEAPNITSYQMQSSFGAHKAEPGRLVVRDDVPPWVRAELEKMGYRVGTRRRTSGPITAIFFDRQHGTMWGGASDFGEDYGIAW